MVRRRAYAPSSHKTCRCAPSRSMKARLWPQSFETHRVPRHLSGRGEKTDDDAVGLADGAAELFADLMQHQTSLRKNGAHGLEVMDHALVADVFDRDPSGHQLCRIGIALVAHRVEFRGMDDGQGKSGKPH